MVNGYESCATKSVVNTLPGQIRWAYRCHGSSAPGSTPLRSSLSGLSYVSGGRGCRPFSGNDLWAGGPGLAHSSYVDSSPLKPSCSLRQCSSARHSPYPATPAGVSIPQKAPDPAWMLKAAREMTLAEPAFLVPQRDGYALRWFPPAVEVDLCGHATLASAHVTAEIDFDGGGEPAEVVAV